MLIAIVSDFQCIDSYSLEAFLLVEKHNDHTYLESEPLFVWCTLQLYNNAL